MCHLQVNLGWSRGSSARAADGGSGRPEGRTVAWGKRLTVCGVEHVGDGFRRTTGCEGREPVKPGRVCPQVRAQQWVDSAVSQRGLFRTDVRLSISPGQRADWHHATPSLNKPQSICDVFVRPIGNAFAGEANAFLDAHI